MKETDIGGVITDAEKKEKEIEQYKLMLNALRGEIRRMDMSNMFRRLDYLFKVVEHRSAFSSDFVISCVGEIESCMAIPEDGDKAEQGE